MLNPNFSPFPVLTTERLILRRFIEADAASLFKLRGDAGVMQYIGRPLAKTVDDAVALINVIDDLLAGNNGITWCISLKSDAEFIGSIGFWRIEKENYRAEIGYMLEPYLQGKGIMYEAVQTVVDYGFREMKLHSIEGRIDPRNGASGALLKKAGFAQEAYFKENYFLSSGFADTAVFSILNPYTDGVEKTGEEQGAVA